MPRSHQVALASNLHALHTREPKLRMQTDVVSERSPSGTTPVVSSLPEHATTVGNSTAQGAKS